MASRTVLAQDDFDCLTLCSCHDADCQPLDAYHGFHDVERPQIIDSLKSGSCNADETYLPVNFFPDEVYALIREGQRTYHKQQESAQALRAKDVGLAAHSQSSARDLEPMRFVSAPLPPPKLFYRTFWRSMTRRIMRLEKLRAVDKAAPA
jgi:hypothetical protein